MHEVIERKINEKFEDHDSLIKCKRLIIVDGGVYVCSYICYFGNMAGCVNNYCSRQKRYDNNDVVFKKVITNGRIL